MALKTNVNSKNNAVKNKEKNSGGGGNNLQKSAQNNSNVPLNKNGFKWTIIILSVLLIVSVIFLCVLSYNLVKIKQEKHQTLLSIVNVEVKENCSNTKAITLLSNVVAGVEYPQLVKVSSKTLSSPQLLRAKAELISSTGESFNVGLTSTENWVLGDDGYFYFNGVLNSASEHIFSTNLTLPNNFSNSSQTNNLHTIVFSVESLSYNLNVATTIWSGAPSSWINEYAIWVA